MQKHYDYIIAGAGLSGLTLAYKIKHSPKLKDKSILLVDRDKKQKNDRTWCFWSKEDELFEDIVFKKWTNITFASRKFEKSFDINPYAYKMIRGIDFYNKIIPQLQAFKDVDFLFEPIESLSSSNDVVQLKTHSISCTSDFAFKSYISDNKDIDFRKDHFVWQHFKGIFIKTSEEKFDANNAHFMDFRVDQGGETRFFYVLPLNKKEALIEIAIFSSEIPKPDFYDSFIQEYINHTIGIDKFDIIEEEVGAIPMTTFNFQKNKSERIINIGTNGGSVKASSGYAFKRIQEDTDTLLKYIEMDRLHKYHPQPNRFTLYDKTMLNAILSNKTTGEEVFTKLFQKLKPQTIFKFLDEKGSFFNDLKIFTAPPTLPFLKAFFEEVFGGKK